MLLLSSIEISCCGGVSRRRRNAEARQSLMLHACLTLFVVVSVTVLSFANLVKSTSKQRNLIINGDNVDPSKYQFFLRSWPDSVPDTNDMLCGASLIHSDIILTAAHCQGGFNYGAMAYDPSTRMFNRYKKVDLQIAFPDYYQNIEVINYDLMVLRLSTPITDIQPVTLNNDPDFPIDNNIGSADNSSLLEGLGFGLTEEGTMARGLRVGHFAPITNDQCYRRLRIANVELTEDVLCVDPSNDESICSGDSGGPLTASLTDPNDDNNIIQVQVGVVSFGNECQPDWVPDGFARVSFFTDWIKKQICKYSRDPPADCFDYYQSKEYNKFISEHGASVAIPFDKAQISFEFRHDFLAEQTAFSIRNLLSNKIEYVGPQYVPKRGGFFNSTFLLPVPGNYAIEVYDTGIDGLTNPDYVNKNYPEGSWVISAKYRNGGRLEALATGDAVFETFQTKQIRLPKNVPPLITDLPSFSPTSSPTESSNPSVVPSLAPSTSYEPTMVEWKNNTHLAIGRVDVDNGTTGGVNATIGTNTFAPASSSSVPLTYSKKSRSHYTRSMMLFLSLGWVVLR